MKRPIAQLLLSGDAKKTNTFLTNTIYIYYISLLNNSRMSGDIKRSTKLLRVYTLFIRPRVKFSKDLFNASSVTTKWVGLLFSGRTVFLC